MITSKPKPWATVTTGFDLGGMIEVATSEGITPAVRELGYAMDDLIVTLSVGIARHDAIRAAWRGVGIR